MIAEIRDLARRMRRAADVLDGLLAGPTTLNENAATAAAIRKEIAFTDLRPKKSRFSAATRRRMAAAQKRRFAKERKAARKAGKQYERRDQ